MSRDRWAALVLWVLGAAVLAASIAMSDSEAIVPHDEAAFHELVDRLAAGEEGDWLVSYTYERTLADGRTIGADVTEGRAGGLHVVRDPTSATAESDEGAFSCELTDDNVECLERPVTDALGPAEVVRTAVDTGAYVVTRLPGVEIAGETGNCYRVFAARGYLPALGAETRTCLTADGIPLSTAIVTIGARDERTATTVTRDPSRADVEALLQDLQATAAADAASVEAEG